MIVKNFRSNPQYRKYIPYDAIDSLVDIFKRLRTT